MQGIERGDFFIFPTFVAGGDYSPKHNNFSAKPVFIDRHIEEEFSVIIIAVGCPTSYFHFATSNILYFVKLFELAQCINIIYNL